MPVPPPDKNLLKASFKRARLWGATVSVIMLIAIIAGICTAAGGCGEHHHGGWVEFVYAVWTAAAPIYFFLEWVYGINWVTAHHPENQPALDYLKGCQDQARAVRVGLAGVIGILLLKSGQ